MRINKRDASLMDAPKQSRGRAGRALTPAQLARQRQQRQLSRMMQDLNDPSQVFEIRPGRDEKSATIRQRVLRAAQDAGKDVAVRKHGNGFLVGLMTADRKTRRGRPRGSGSKS